MTHIIATISLMVCNLAFMRFLIYGRESKKISEVPWVLICGAGMILCELAVVFMCR